MMQACIRHHLTAVVPNDKQKGHKAHDHQVRTIKMQPPAGIAGNLQDHAGGLSFILASYVHFFTTCLAVHMHSIVTSKNVWLPSPHSIKASLNTGCGFAGHQNKLGWRSSLEPRSGLIQIIGGQSC